MTKGMIEEFEIEVPPRATQHRIASSLSALDEKIELNRRPMPPWKESHRPFSRSGCGLPLPWSNRRNAGQRVGADSEGVEHRKLGEIVAVQNGDAFKSSDFMDDGDARIIKIKNIGNKLVDVRATRNLFLIV